ncbi:MAG: NCS2 family permease, partial [Deltaproteobacteria bacterium]|nr:NCS2 family permease [Deltaproteobacteria bacterium]
MGELLEQIFKLKENGTTPRQELRGGVVTFLTMSYIIFVQPGVLSMCGMDFGAVMVATCLSAALATFVMAFGANYPVALAPCMGENF